MVQQIPAALAAANPAAEPVVAVMQTSRRAARRPPFPARPSRGDAIHGDDRCSRSKPPPRCARRRGQPRLYGAQCRAGRGFDWTSSRTPRRTCRCSRKKGPRAAPSVGQAVHAGREADRSHCRRRPQTCSCSYRCARLDRSTQRLVLVPARSERVLACSRHLAFEALPLPAGSPRLALQRQSASADVLEFLADRVEGNLLAAHQG